MKKITIGTLAHVDAGKTTLSEEMLYTAGAIRSRGRVDDGNSHMDTDEMERQRGITIFSNVAPFSYRETDFILLDTPGHVDFSAEAERVFPVLDYAVLVISGTDGVQSHTETLWKLLDRYQVPVFLFISKMDIACKDPTALLEECKQVLHPGCSNMASGNQEDLAYLSEEAMEEYLRDGTVSDDTVRNMILSRELFPVYFGSGLHGDGVLELMDGLDRFTCMPVYHTDPGARVFQIRHDKNGARLTFLKMTGGTLSVKDSISYFHHGQTVEEKIHQIRSYSGDRFTVVNEASAGDIVAVCGLEHTAPGLGIGSEHGSTVPVMESVMTCRIEAVDGTSAPVLLSKMQILTEEDPLLRVVWDDNLGEIQIQIMGDIQTEVLKDQIRRRFDIETEIGPRQIMYRETIANAVEGIGHFEPLRHYAEVHLWLSPLPRGTGLIFDSDCSEDLLDRNWQRLILTHLEEKQHRGVLTGAPITDMKITLIAGRAHAKHTEGGDFRQATYRAVRQGLMKAESILLEPYYSFTANCPSETVGRIINDIKSFNGTVTDTETSSDGSMGTVTGRAPVDRLSGYLSTFPSITRGKGRISVWPDGYEACARTDEIVDASGYDPLRDTENPSGSVFCSHGSGITIPWDQVSEHMHIDTGVEKETQTEVRPIIRYRDLSFDDKELEEIMDREFGPIRRPVYSRPQVNKAPETKEQKEKKSYLIIDGYNVIYGWEDLKRLAQDDMDLARATLMDILANYHGFTQTEVVLVFDAYRVRDYSRKAEDYHGIHVVYTKPKQSADSYIQTLSREIGKNYSVRVVTSDSLIQLTALSAGVLRVSTREFRNEIRWALDQIESVLKKNENSLHGTKLEELYGKE